MTAEQKAALQRAGWTVVTDGFWRSPITARDYTDAEALGMLALSAIRKRRGGVPVYNQRRRRCTR